MKKAIIAALIIMCMFSLGATGASIYLEERAEENLQEVFSCLSNDYKRGTVLEIRNNENGKSVLALVSGSAEMMDGVAVLLNQRAASEIGLDGYADVSISVAIESDEKDEESGWYKIFIKSVATNEEASLLSALLEENDMKASAVLRDGLIDIYVRYIPLYMLSEQQQKLENMGFTHTYTSMDENPYS
ncbi:MAG TPA: hypothetical protein IAB12_01855 [Candidatus Ornithospirochaeta avicola]|uniref:SPOR domain-containing protein n=1 Tax=Candidatus Ornithospirochaeta avicola TaxID=2840896 RepID=A0A9D1PSG8_9SPIO|nr:hypothetical protein [Candidatus Ornithospirochaeta avicola]